MQGISLPPAPSVPPAPSSPARFDLAIVVLMVLGGCALRLHYLGAASLWSDEASSWSVSAPELDGFARRLIDEEKKPPLYFLALHFWMRAFGDSEAALRSLSAVFWPLQAILLFLIGRKVCARWGLVALFLAAFSPMFITYGLEARPYSMLLCAQLWVLHLVLKWLEEPSNRLAFLLGVASILVVSLQFTGALFLAPVFTYLVIRHRREPGLWGRILLSQGVAAVLFTGMLLLWMPGIFAGLRGLDHAWWAPPPSLLQVLSTPVRSLVAASTWSDPEVSRGWLLLKGASATGLALLSLFGIAVSRQRGILAVSSLGVMGVFIVYSVTRANLLNSRYYIGCTPVLLLGIACACQVLSGRFRKSAPFLIPGLGVAAGLLLWVVPPLSRIPGYAPAVQGVLAREAGRVILLSGGWDAPSVRYYARRAADRVSLREASASLQAGRPEGPCYYLESSLYGNPTAAPVRDVDGRPILTELVSDGAGMRVFRLNPR